MDALPPISLELPSWTASELARAPQAIEDVEARMRFVIGLARSNVDHATGGPFAAAVFESGSGRLVSVGVNIVVRANCSAAHGEMMAVMFAQQVLGTYDLGMDEGVGHELVTSAQPCAMCFGAIPWSGIERVVCGARGDDVRAIGFDEGPVPDDWIDALNARGIEVRTGVCRDDAVSVLEEYRRQGGLLYNSGSPKPGRVST